MRLRNVLLAAIGSVLMIGAGVTLVAVLGADPTNTSSQAAQRTASDPAGASNAAAVVSPAVKQTNTSGGVAKSSGSGSRATGAQTSDGSYDDGNSGSGDSEHGGERE